MRSLLALAGLLVAAAATADTYKWVDKDGVVHYSDRPVPGAERIDLMEAQTYSAPPAPSVRSSTPDDKSAGFSGYREFEIYSPVPDETFRNTGNQVTVRIRIDPELQPNHSIWIYLDGRRVDGLPQTGDTFQLTEVYRGTHTVTAVIADGEGRTVLQSQPVTFHMHQTSLLSPQSPLRRTPPKSGGN